CPAIDHVYLFKNVEAIRELFAEAGLYINREITLPVEGIAEGSNKLECAEINYAAIVKCKEM
ncbi:hypothetical protein KA005_32165, partial [bacterium]|nr:hypothetical protein [bacterium]